MRLVRRSVRQLCPWMRNIRGSDCRFQTRRTMARAQLAEISVSSDVVGGHASRRPGGALPIRPARAEQVSVSNFTAWSCVDFIVSPLCIARRLTHSARVYR